LQPAAISSTQPTSEPGSWLAGLAQKGGTEITWESSFREFLVEAFSPESRVHAWNNAALPDVIVEFLTSCPEKPRLETRRFAIFSGAPTYGGGSRGLLWVDCAHPAERAIFVAMTKYRRDMYCIDIYLSDASSLPALPVHFLATLHHWLRSHESGPVICIDLHNCRGYLWSFDPAQCGLEQSTIKPRPRFRAALRGAA